MLLLLGVDGKPCYRAPGVMWLPFLYPVRVDTGLYKYT